MRTWLLVGLLSLGLLRSQAVRAEEARPASTRLTALPRLVTPTHAWFKDWTGWALATAGSFALIVGGTDLGLTYPRWAGSNGSGPSAPDASGRITADLVVLCASVALLVGAATRFALVAARARHDRVRFGFLPSGLTVHFR